MRLPTRRTLWLSVAVLSVVVVGAWLLAPRSRITQENFDRIQNGMTYDDVTGILGKPTPLFGIGHVSGTWEEGWEDGPSDIMVEFNEIGDALHNVSLGQGLWTYWFVHGSVAGKAKAGGADCSPKRWKLG